MSYEIQLKAGAAEVIEGADTYQQEGPLTTFFEARPGRSAVDSWARRLASYHTADIVRIRCMPSLAEGDRAQSGRRLTDI